MKTEITSKHVTYVTSRITNAVKEQSERLESYTKALEEINKVLAALESFNGKIINKKFFDLHQEVAGKNYDGTDRMYCPWSLQARLVWNSDNEFTFMYSYTRGDRHTFNVKGRSKFELIVAARAELIRVGVSVSRIQETITSLRSADVESLVKSIESVFEACPVSDVWDALLAEAKSFNYHN